MKDRIDFPQPPLMTELLLLPDGQILVHNLTPAFAKLLSKLNPDDAKMLSRITDHVSRPTPYASP